MKKSSHCQQIIHSGNSVQINYQFNIPQKTRKMLIETLQLQIPKVASAVKSIFDYNTNGKSTLNAQALNVINFSTIKSKKNKELRAIIKTMQVLIASYRGNAPTNNPFFIAKTIEEITTFHPNISDDQIAIIRQRIRSL